MSKCFNNSNQCLIHKAKSEEIDLVWDRYEAMQPQCVFGKQGICCRICLKGPCRINPFGKGPQEGICGATADTIVARNLVRMIASGTAAHSLHGKDIAKTLSKINDNETQNNYQVKDVNKLKEISNKLGIRSTDKSIQKLAQEVANITLKDYIREDKGCNWLATTITKLRLDKLKDLGIELTNIQSSVMEIMSRTHIGNDADPMNLLLAGLKCSLGDYTGMQIATNLSDVLFGTPKPIISEANLGVIKEDAVNIAVHGHNPLLSEIIVDVADEMQEEAINAGAKAGINIVGICCTGNEVLLRRGVPLATNYLSQELAILTGAIEAMVVDVQCIMPSLSKVSACYHTEFFTTMADTKIPGATHIELNEMGAAKNAKLIIEKAIEAFSKRDDTKIEIPEEKNQVIAGFSKEAILELLSEVNSNRPLEPLVENIVNGKIKGIALFAGCNNVKITQDKNFFEMAKRLLTDNILILATGCAAGAFAKNSLMSSQATEEYAGDSLQEVLTMLGYQAGLEAPLPPILHMGSCVDNSRGIDLVVDIANELGVDLDQLPLVASAPELMSEKSISIGTWMVTLGLPVHIGLMPPVTGSPLVTETLTSGLKELVGGYFIVQEEPTKAAESLIEIIEERRLNLKEDY